MSGIQKEYAQSLHSSDLSNNELSYRHDTDALAAVSLGVTEFGAMLLRAKLSYTRNIPDPNVTLPLLAEWRRRVRQKALKKGWEKKSDAVAHLSYWHWIDVKCIMCHGRMYEVVVGTPALGAIVCPVCEGSGEKPYDYEPDVNQHVKDSVGTLKRIYSLALGSASHKLGKKDI